MIFLVYKYFFLCDKVTNVVNSYLFAFLNADECQNTCADPENSVRVIVVGCVWRGEGHGNDFFSNQRISQTVMTDLPRETIGP